MKDFLFQWFKKVRSSNLSTNGSDLIKKKLLENISKLRIQIVTASNCWADKIGAIYPTSIFVARMLVSIQRLATSDGVFDTRQFY